MAIDWKGVFPALTTKFDGGDQLAGIQVLVVRGEADLATAVAAGFVVDPWHSGQQLHHPDVAA